MGISPYAVFICIRAECTIPILLHDSVANRLLEKDLLRHCKGEFYVYCVDYIVKDENWWEKNRKIMHSQNCCR